MKTSYKALGSWPRKLISPNQDVQAKEKKTLGKIKWTLKILKITYLWKDTIEIITRNNYH